MFRKTSRLIVVMTLIVLISVTVRARLAVAGSDMSICQTSVVKHIVSPNNQWLATVSEEVCQGAYGFSSGTGSSVQIISTSNSKTQATVFGIDTEGDSEVDPVISWDSANTLHILTYPQDIGIQKSLFSSVKITYSYK